MAKIIMIQGTMSNVGKSLLAAGTVPHLQAGRLSARTVQGTEYGAKFIYHEGRA